ncbi:MAG: M15 family metallopeptidase [Oscillospiraceae bacterium]|jgi:D-alanyl-D-alanine carboxypeptidase|nr:M15 family metallopeptidase [Oscillospiraceae bacterium]
MKRLCTICAVFVVIALLIARYAPEDSPSADGESHAWETGVAAAAAASGDYLLLVNADNPLTDGAPDFEIVSAYRVVPLLNRNIELEAGTLGALALLFRGARDAGIENLVVNDGYRSRAEQQRIYDATEDKAFVQPPDCSEHQTGLAADIAARGVDRDEMAGSAEGQWLAENAWKYGFILRYPPDKIDITGISYEPWHFRYVGTEAAKYMFENGLCLEEYVDKSD